MPDRHRHAGSRPADVKPLGRDAVVLVTPGGKGKMECLRLPSQLGTAGFLFLEAYS
jgi:hypothetical protein